MERVTARLGKAGTGVLVAILWLVSAVLGLWEILIIRGMVLRIYSRLFVGESTSGHEYWGGVTLGNWLVLILAVVWIGTTIGLGEYYSKHYGEPNSWRWLGRVLGVEVAVLVLALII